MKRWRQQPPITEKPVGRPPPHDLDVERMLLASLLLDNSLIPEIASWLEPGDFYAPRSQDVYRAILSLSQKGDPVDFVTLTAALPNLSAADLTTWAEHTLASNSASYATIVKKTSDARQLLGILQRAVEATYGKSDIEAVRAQLITELVSLEQGEGSGNFEPIARAVTEGLKAVERAMQGRSGIPTGFEQFDARTGGLQASELVFIAARPGMGKTALGQAIGVNAAKRGYRVAFASLEMTAAQIGMRLISGDTKIENRDLRRGRLADRDFGRIIESTSRLSALPFWLLDSERSWPRLQAKIRGLKLRQSDLSLVVLDYIGLVKVPTERERYLELGVISSEAKELAMALKIAVVICSQLNRAVESRTDKKPQLSDLRESGNLEQDADVVMLLHRPSYYDPQFQPRQLTYLDIAKNRNGATGLLKLHFDEKTVSFTDWIEPPAARDITQAREAG